MRSLRVCLTLTLALLVLGSGAGLTAPRAAGDSAARTAGRVQAPARQTQPASKGIEAQLAKLTAADGAAQDGFGSSIALDGDTAVVGASSDDAGAGEIQGSAYVFCRNQGGPGSWGQVAKLTAAGGEAWDEFGYSISISGDTVVVGADLDNVGDQPDQGSAYVFYRDQGGPDAWGLVAQLTAADGAANDLFGSSVSVDGDTIVVGARVDAISYYSGKGAAYIFYRDQGGPDMWGQVARIVASDGQMDDYFGTSVSVDGDTAIIGAPGADISWGSQGKAYVFYRDQGGADAWGQVATLAVPDGWQGDNLGYAVAVDGDVALVGAYGAFGGSMQGAAYLYYRNLGGADTWGQAARLTAFDGASGDYMGYSVALEGDLALVGGYGADIGGNLDQGAAWVFRRDHGGPDAWGQLHKIWAADGGPGDWFGWRASVSGETLLVGASAAAVGGNAGQGAAYVFDLTNQVPVAADDSYATAVNTARHVAAPGVLLNDRDADGDPLTASLVTGPGHGTLELHADGSFIYTPPAHWSGVDAFTYHAHDGLTDSNVATVEITVAGYRSYVPMVPRLRRYPPVPDAPILYPISNPYGDGTYTVSWSMPPGAEGGMLEEDDNPGFASPETVFDFWGSSTTLGGREGGTYYYRVASWNSYGRGAWSNIESVYVNPGGWGYLHFMDFEGEFPGPWEVADADGALNGEFFWAKRDCRRYAGGFAGWAVGGGTGGSLLGCRESYPNDAESWMVYGPFSLEGAGGADLTFALWLKSQIYHDGVLVLASTDGSNFYGGGVSGDSEGWVGLGLGLADVPDLGSVLEQPQVWVALVFISDESGNADDGGYVDDILLRRHLGAVAEGEARAPALPAGLHWEPVRRSLRR